MLAFRTTEVYYRNKYSHTPMESLFVFTYYSWEHKKHVSYLTKIMRFIIIWDIELRTGCVYQIITKQSEIIAFDLNGDSDYSSGTVIKRSFIFVSKRLLASLKTSLGGRLSSGCDLRTGVGSRFNLFTRVYEDQIYTEVGDQVWRVTLKKKVNSFMTSHTWSSAPEMDD